MGDLKHRTLINGIGGILLLLFIFFAEFPYFRWFFTGAIALICAFAVYEFYGLVKKKGFDPAVTLGIVVAVLYIYASFIKTQSISDRGSAFWDNSPTIILALTFFASFAFFAVTRKSPIVNIATTFFGIVYLAIPLSLVIRIAYFFNYHGLQDLYFEGSWWLLYLLAVTKSGDMGGYFIGRYFGRHKLAHYLSPNKTLEGAVGGLVASTLISCLVCYAGKQFNVFVHFSYFAALIMGVVIGILGQIGDLAESLLKRDAKVKDSSHIPGVGGVLDMIDSLIFTIPIVYIFLKIYYSSTLHSV